jgi:hypothetical protein
VEGVVVHRQQAEQVVVVLGHRLARPVAIGRPDLELLIAAAELHGAHRAGTGPWRERGKPHPRPNPLTSGRLVPNATFAPSVDGVRAHSCSTGGLVDRFSTALRTAGLVVRPPGKPVAWTTHRHPYADGTDPRSSVASATG